jgi:hypothetical protein
MFDEAIPMTKRDNFGGDGGGGDRDGRRKRWYFSHYIKIIESEGGIWSGCLPLFLCERGLSESEGLRSQKNLRASRKFSPIAMRKTQNRFKNIEEARNAYGFRPCMFSCPAVIKN